MVQQSSNHMSKLGDLKSLGSLELLRMHAAILGALKEKQILRTTNTPTGDYAEWLVARWMEEVGRIDATGGGLVTNSHKGYDIIDREKMRYQVKGRRLTSQNQSRELGVVRDLNDDNFDYLIAVVFEEDWDVKVAAQIPVEILRSMSNPIKSRINGHKFCLSDKLLEAVGVTLITGGIRGVQCAFK